MKARKIQLRIDTSTNWTTVDPILEEGEAGLESNTGRIKIGDGSNLWSVLSYFEVIGPTHLNAYTVLTVPAAANHTGAIIYISDESGGAQPAFSDGTNWRRFTDRAPIT